MKKIAYSFCAIAIILAMSCNKVNEKIENIVTMPQGVLALQKFDSDADAFISILAQDRGEDTRLFDSFSITASFKGENGEKTLVNSVHFNELQLPIAQNSVDSYNQKFYPQDASFKTIADKFGKKITIKVDGGAGFPSFEHHIKMPDRMSIENYAEMRVSKSEGAKVIFMPETGDGERLDFALLDTSFDPSNTSADDKRPYFYKHDFKKGLSEFFFTPDEIKGFKVGRDVNLKLLRAIREFVQIGGKRVEIRLVTIQNSTGIPIID
jgi:hypothetical protein